MNARTLEDRVLTLERELDALKRRLDTDSARDDWRETVGMFRGDAAFREIVDAGRAIRQAERSAG